MGSLKGCIISSGRCGTQLLNICLRGHPDIKAEEEILNNSIVPDFNGMLISEYLGKPLEVKADGRLDTDPIRTVEYLELAWSKCNIFKLLYSHLNQDLTDYLTESGIKIVHLTRNPIYIFTSLYVAEKTNRWKTTKYEESDSTTTINIPIDKFNSFVDYYNELKSFWDQYSYNVAYEDMVEHWDEVVHNVQMYLGIRPIKLDQYTKKTISRPLEQVIENYSELKQSKYGNLL